MYPQIRQKAILDILQEEGYVTVAYLTRRLHYSTATINRDLNQLERQGFIRRSYGGAELNKNHDARLPFRYHKMKTEKRLIGETAAHLVQPGDILFVDGTTTTQSMAPHLVGIEGITVITNNLTLAEYLSSQQVDVVSLGGRIVEPPSMVCSEETMRQAAGYRANKFFFSTGGFTADGLIGSGRQATYHPLLQTMAANAQKRYFLADHDKVNGPVEVVLFDFGQVDGVVSDYAFPASTRQRYPGTAFISVTKESE